MRLALIICLCTHFCSTAWCQQANLASSQKTSAEVQKSQLVREVANYFKKHPELERRLLDPHYKIPEQTWSYGAQTYRNRAVMLHLITLQVQAMEARNAVNTLQDVFDHKYGIGSKSHKDKGTINNPLSLFGHPVQKEILGKNGRSKSLKVYHALRLTIKNDLIRFARNQSLEWHQQPSATKLDSILNFLHETHPEKTQRLEALLQQYNLDLSILLSRAINLHLLS